MTRLNFLVTRANIAYLDSEVGVTLRLVNVTVVDYTDASSNFTAINAISADPSLDVELEKNGGARIVPKSATPQNP